VRQYPCRLDRPIDKNEIKIMTDTKKAPNYSAAQIAVIRAAAPLDMAKAKFLAKELGKTYRSVIAKAKSEDIEYVPKAVAKKRVGGATKKAMIATISSLSDVPETTLGGLEKATAISLAALVVSFEALTARIPADSES
jgi:hypothetical protein